MFMCRCCIYSSVYDCIELHYAIMLVFITSNIEQASKNASGQVHSLCENLQHVTTLSFISLKQRLSDGRGEDLYFNQILLFPWCLYFPLPGDMIYSKINGHVWFSTEGHVLVRRCCDRLW